MKNFFFFKAFEIFLCQQLLNECNALNKEIFGENLLDLYEEVLSKCCAKLEKEMGSILMYNFKNK